MFTPPTPVLSLRSNRSPSLSSQPPPTPVGEQTSLLGWWVLVGTDPLCGNLSVLPSAPLWLCSPAWLRSFPPPRPAVSAREGASSVWKPFLLHSSLLLVQVPSLYFVSVFSFFFYPTQVRGEFLAFWEVWRLLPAFSRCSVGVVPHVDVFLMYLWRGRWSPRLTLPPSWSSSSSLWFWFAFPWWLVMLNIFHVSVYHLYTFFGKTSIQVLCPLFCLFVCFLPIFWLG